MSNHSMGFEFTKLPRKPHTFYGGGEPVRDVVSEALCEKLQRLDVARLAVEREVGQLQAMLEDRKGQLLRLESERQQLTAALNNTSHMSQTSHLWDVARSVPCIPQRALIGAPVLDYATLTEAASQKQIVITRVQYILQVLGNATTRVLYEMLASQGVAIPNPQRLSQILSEADQFEADRSQGWSLKGEKPGVRRPGFSISTATPSGDGS